MIVFSELETYCVTAVVQFLNKQLLWTSDFYSKHYSTNNEDYDSYEQYFFSESKTYYATGMC